VGKLVFSLERPLGNWVGGWNSDRGSEETCVKKMASASLVII